MADVVGAVVFALSWLVVTAVFFYMNYQVWFRYPAYFAGVAKRSKRNPFDVFGLFDGYIHSRYFKTITRLTAVGGLLIALTPICLLLLVLLGVLQ